MDWRKEQADVYDRIVKESGGHQYLYTKETLGKLDGIIPRNGKIIDIGCGTGHVAESLNGREWYGVDISPKSVEYAKNFYNDVKVGDATSRIPFKDDSFDVALSLSTMHHAYDNIDDIVSETKRVLKPSGLFVIIEHDEQNLHIKMLHKSFLRVVPFKHERALSVEEVSRSLIKHGFTIESIGGTILEADQQGMKPPFYVRMIKGPFLVLLRFLMFGKPSEFVIKARKVKK